MMEKLVSLAPLDPPESLVLPGHREREDHLELQAPRDDRERREPRENPVWRDLKERLALLALKDHLASLVLKDSGESLAQLVNKVYPVLQVQMDLRARWVLQVCPA